MSDKIEGNSLTQKKREEAPVSHVSGPVVQAVSRKKTWWRRILENIISDSRDNIRDSIIDDVVSPAIGNLLIDALSGSIKAIFNGGRSSGRGSSNADRVSYRNYYDDGYGTRRSSRERRESNGFRVLDDAIVETRGDAEMVIDRLDEIIDTYKAATILDLCELVGLPVPSDHTLAAYGWTSIASARVEKVRDGFLIRLPAPRPLN